MLQSSIPYTERHFQRIDRLIQRSFILDYTLQSMQLQADDNKLGPASESSSAAVQVPSNIESSAKKRKRSLESEASNTTKKQKIDSADLGEKAKKKSLSKHK